jgi:hypothetical protein
MRPLVRYVLHVVSTDWLFFSASLRELLNCPQLNLPIFFHHPPPSPSSTELSSIGELLTQPLTPLIAHPSQFQTIASIFSDVNSFSIPHKLPRYTNFTKSMGKESWSLAPRGGSSVYGGGGGGGQVTIVLVEPTIYVTVNNYYYYYR